MDALESYNLIVPCSLTQRCPTSFNVQPYTVTLVQSREGRQRLAACMLGPNKARVLQAPVTAVFAADLGVYACR